MAYFAMESNKNQEKKRTLTKQSICLAVIQIKDPKITFLVH